MYNFINLIIEKSMKKPLIIFSILSIITACSISGIDATEAQINHVTRAESALATWNVGLQDTYQLGISRNVASGYVANPPYWIALSDEECNGVGIPENLQINCDLTGGTLGITSFTYNPATGIISDITIILLNSFLNSNSYSDAQKLIVYIHEIGHSLGLDHHVSNDHIMYPSLSGMLATRITPHADELAIINYVYSGASVNDPIGYAGWADYFIEAGSNAVYYSSLPVFYIYPYLLPFPETKSGAMPKGEVLPENYVTVIKKLKSDGSCEHEVYDKNNNLIESYTHKKFEVQ